MQRSQHLLEPIYAWTIQLPRKFRIGCCVNATSFETLHNKFLPRITHLESSETSLFLCSMPPRSMCNLGLDSSRECRPTSSPGRSAVRIQQKVCWTPESVSALWIQPTNQPPYRPTLFHSRYTAIWHRSNNGKLWSNDGISKNTDKKKEKKEDEEGETNQ